VQYLRCLSEVEDATHVWKCQDPRTLVEVWTKAITNLEVWLKKQRTEPGITRPICAKLVAWQSGSAAELAAGIFLGLKDAGSQSRNRMSSVGKLYSIRRSPSPGVARSPTTLSRMDQQPTLRTSVVADSLNTEIMGYCMRHVVGQPKQGATRYRKLGGKGSRN
jgi:hypothetical protein